MQSNHVADLLRLINGFQVSRAISTFVELGIADLLEGGARQIGELALATGAHQRSLYRLLRSLAEAGVLDEQSSGGFSLSPMGHYLRADIAASVAPWARLIGRDYLWQAWGAMVEGIRTGATAFDQSHGCSVWEYRFRNLSESAIFDRAMASLTETVALAAIESYDFGRYRHLVDVGGGQGAFLSKILTANTNLQGTLFDQPHVVSRVADSLCQGVLAGRCQTVAGDFFGSVPKGGDACLLKSVLHDWDDDRCVAILKSCRRAMPPDGTLIVIENVIGTSNDYPEHMDLAMLVVTGGIERTEAEFATLYRDAGFSLTRIVPLCSSACVVEGKPIAGYND